MCPFFSIVIPVYNCEETILQTINSVLFQTCKDYEIIIVNDCSIDNTLHIIEEAKVMSNKIFVINNVRNIGVAESRNIGFNIAKGNYIALLDGDDVWLPDKLEKQKYVIESTNCDICCTSYNFIDENSCDIKRPYIIPEYISYEMMLRQNYIGCSTVVIRSNLLSNKSMNSSFQHEDYALWLNLARNGAKIVGITDPLMNYRIQASSRSYNKTNAAKGRMKIYLKQEKLGVINSFYYFSCYAINGIKKKLL